MQVIADMISWLEQRWRSFHFDNKVFPPLAVEALEMFQPARKVSRQELFDWFLAGHDVPLPFEVDSRFGQPPLTLLRRERFCLEAYYWLDGTTSIHAHGFSGAFQVLEGASLHSRYTFLSEHRWSGHFETGLLKTKEQEILRQADIRMIDGGTAGIHALFHLDQPSISLVIRSYLEPDQLPQYKYYPPYVAEDPFFQPALFKRRLDLIETHLRIAPEETTVRLKERLPQCDILEQFRVVARAMKTLPERSDLWSSLLQSLKALHPEHGQALCESLREKARRDDLAHRRTSLTQASHRLLLGLLALCDGREQLLGLLSDFDNQRDSLDALFGILWDMAGIDNSTSRLLGFVLSPAMLLSLEAVLRELPESERVAWVMASCEERALSCSPREVQKALFRVEYIPVLKSLFH